MTKEQDEQVNAFSTSALYPKAVIPSCGEISLYEKVRIDDRIVSMVAFVVCSVDEHGRQDILAVELTLEESEKVYLRLFRGL